MVFTHEIKGIRLLELQTLLHANVDVRKISRRLDLHRASIRYWRGRWGIQSAFKAHPRLSSEENDRRLKAYHHSSGYREAAEKLGISYTAFCFWRRKMNLPSKHRIGNEKAPLALLMRKQARMDDLEIALQLGFLSTSTIGTAVCKVNALIGSLMMMLCAVDKECPYKPLLPGFDASKVKLQVRTRTGLRMV